MKILQITTSAISLPFLEGAIRHSMEQGAEVVAAAAPGPELESFGKRINVRIQPIPMLRKITPFSDWKTLFLLWNWMRLERPDIVHAHTPKAGWLSMLAALLAGVPVRIFHIHGLPYLGGNTIGSRLLRLASWMSCACSTLVLSVSNSICDQAVNDRLCPVEKIRVLGSGSIDGVDAMHKFIPAARHPDPFTVLFVGRLATDKGLKELSEAWTYVRQTHPEAKLLIAGEPDARDCADGKLIEALSKDESVKMLGWVQDMAAVYASANLVVLPSYREGMGMALLEAAAMALPTVASDIPGCRDAVIDGRTGKLVPVRDARALAAAILDYAGNPELQVLHGLAGRLRVASDFVPTQIRRLTYATYLDQFESTVLRRSRLSVAKRMLDVAVAAITLVLLLPLLLICAGAIRIFLGAPVLFRQLRPGLDGSPFNMYKFRTMTADRDEAGALLPDGKRLNWLGIWLRKTSLDELPELWNVLRGEMSLVGPRPLLMKYTPYFSAEERLRFAARPGITGWAQIHGRNYSPWSLRLANDVWYVRNWSLMLDLQILIQTLWQVFSQKDIAVDANTVLRDLNEERQNSGVF